MRIQARCCRRTIADAQRFPASLTKVMTLYLLFEQLESGKMKLDTMMPVSEYASEQAPTKLGLREGDKLKVEDAIKGLVTRSANDASVVIAEAISGDVDEFAKLMTRKARALGMSRTTYRNPNGLPESGAGHHRARPGDCSAGRSRTASRATTSYFATNSFYYRGKAIRNHNKLLGRVEGVDGIKTGFTRASGFNLVTSMKRGNRHLVGVVLGGRSGGSRDAIMRNLLAEHLERGATKRTVAAITENGAAPVAVAQADDAPATASAKPAIKPVESKTVDLKPTAAFERLRRRRQSRTARHRAGAGCDRGAAEPVATPSAPAQASAPATPQQRMAPLTNGVVSAQALAPIPGSTEPMTPVRVKTLQVKAGPMKVASAGPTQIVPQPAPSQPVVTSTVEPPKSNTVAKSDLAPLLPTTARARASSARCRPARWPMPSPSPRAAAAPAAGSGCRRTCAACEPLRRLPQGRSSRRSPRSVREAGSSRSARSRARPRRRHA